MTLEPGWVDGVEGDSWRLNFRGYCMWGLRLGTRAALSLRRPGLAVLSPWGRKLSLSLA